jgi:hypothetical protein
MLYLYYYYDYRDNARNRNNYPTKVEELPSLTSATTTRKCDNELFDEYNNNIDSACFFFIITLYFRCDEFLFIYFCIFQFLTNADFQ